LSPADDAHQSQAIPPAHETQNRDTSCSMVSRAPLAKLKRAGRSESAAPGFAS
jgi:predicted dithiol-disulfide oxidoreductase (DUF899 family)